jgi:hypothetical protein
MTLEILCFKTQLIIFLYNFCIFKDENLCFKAENIYVNTRFKFFCTFDHVHVTCTCSRATFRRYDKSIVVNFINLFRFVEQMSDNYFLPWILSFRAKMLE